MLTLVFMLLVLYVLLLYLETEVFRLELHKTMHPNLYTQPWYEHLGVDKIDPEMQQQITLGKTRTKNKSIVICSLCRNVSQKIDHVKKLFSRIGKEFQYYKIVLMENDSNDNTRPLLLEWESNDDHVTVLTCCDIGSCQCILKKKTALQFGGASESRLVNMAQYRSRLLNYVKENSQIYDYCLMADFDLGGAFCLDSFFINFTFDFEWDAFFVNGRNTVPGTFGFQTVAYDSLAFVSMNQEYDEIKTDPFFLLGQLRRMNHLINVSYNSGPFRVKSAFNGYGLYKVSSLHSASYIGKPICEHINLHESMFRSGSNKLYLNPQWICYAETQGVGGTSLITTFLSGFKK